MKATVTTKEFLEAIKTIEGSLDTKPKSIISNVCISIISNVCIKIKSYYLELVATDGNSLTMVKVVPQYDDTLNKDLIDKEFLFNVDSIKRAIDKTSKIIELEFNYTDNNNKSMIISNNDSSVALRSIEGQYPKYEGLIPYSDSYDKIKRDDAECVTIGLSRKLLLDILKSYDSKLDDILKFEIPIDNYRYISIQPRGVNNGRKYSILMPVSLR